MKQLICPKCAAVLPRPESKEEDSVTCFLCGKSIRLARRGSDGAAGAKRPAAVASRPRVAPAVNRVAAAAAPPSPAQPLPDYLRSTPVTPLLVGQSAAAPAPARRSLAAWLIAVLVLLLVGGAGAGVTIALCLRNHPQPNTGTGSAAANQDDANPQPPPPVPQEDGAEPADPVGEPGGPVAESEVREVVQLNARGDAAFLRTYRFSVKNYAVVKSVFSNANVARRDLGFRDHWQEIKNWRVQFKDDASAMLVRWTVLGLARLGADKQLWEAPLAEEKGLRLVSSVSHEGVFSGKIPLRIGPQELVLPLTRVVRGPQGSSNVQLLNGPPRIAVRMPAAAARTGGSGEPRWEIHNKPRLMACLGRVYGEGKFARWWTARTVFKNVSGQTLHDYSIRFRMSDYAASWTEFSCPLVLPGQTVVDAYFPLLNNDKLVKETGDCTSRLEVECSYRLGEGAPVRKSESRVINVLSRNQILQWSLPPHEHLDFFDSRCNYPEILAAMVTKDDKVMEEMAGRISRAVSIAPDDLVLKIIRSRNKDTPEAGAAVCINSLHAYRFLRGLYYFMANYIRYTTPGGDQFDGHFSQTVKYGRDVITNKAGTCIDLSILYGSVCMAAGLKPQLILKPGHCFLIVPLPQPLLVPWPNDKGQMVDEKGNCRLIQVDFLGVETTRIGSESFEGAWVEGTAKYLQLRKEHKPMLEVDVVGEKNRGIRSLSFPAASLKSLGIDDDDERWARAIGSGSPLSGGSGPQGRSENRGSGGSGGSGGSPNRQGGQAAGNLVGKWHSTGQLPDGSLYVYVLTLSKDGNYTLRQQIQPRLQRGGHGLPVVNNLAGTYKTNETAIVFTTMDGEEQVCDYSFRGPWLRVAIPHPTYRSINFQFRRVPE